MMLGAFLVTYFIISVIMAFLLAWEDRHRMNSEQWAIEVMLAIVAWPLYVLCLIVGYIFKKISKE